MYKHIIFDIDGTLVDTECAVLRSLAATIAQLQDRIIEPNALKFALGIPGDVTLRQLGFKDLEAPNKVWHQIQQDQFPVQHLFTGIEQLIGELHNQGVQLGIITSKNRDEYTKDFLPNVISHLLPTVICAEDAAEPKPSAAPMAKYLEITGADPEQVLYIGDTIYDQQCAQKAGVDFGLALWGCASPRHIYAKHYLTDPQSVLRILAPKTKQSTWVSWAIELQFIAQAGITYCRDPFDMERFERLREISAEIMAHQSEIPIAKVRDMFCNETGFQTPKLDTRAAIFENDKILLVKESDGKWSMPGGWVDVNQTIRSNTIKEVKEEAGLDVIPTRMIALEDRNLHNVPQYAYGICKAFVLCEVIGGNFTPNMETVKSDYFALDQLPELALDKNTAAQIALCFQAAAADNWSTVFD